MKTEGTTQTHISPPFKGMGGIIHIAAWGILFGLPFIFLYNYAKKEKRYHRPLFLLMFLFYCSSAENVFPIVKYCGLSRSNRSLRFGEHQFNRTVFLRAKHCRRRRCLVTYLCGDKHIFFRKFTRHKIHIVCG